MHFIVTVCELCFSREGAVPVRAWCDAVDSFEVSNEMALVHATDSSNDLFHAEKSGGEQSCRLLHAQ